MRGGTEVKVFNTEDTEKRGEKLKMRKAGME